MGGTDSGLVLLAFKGTVSRDFSVCHRRQRNRWCTLSCEYLPEFLGKFKAALMRYSGAWGNWSIKKPEVNSIVALSLSSKLFTCQGLGLWSWKGLHNTVHKSLMMCCAGKTFMCTQLKVEGGRCFIVVGLKLYSPFGLGKNCFNLFSGGFWNMPKLRLMLRKNCWKHLLPDPTFLIEHQSNFDRYFYNWTLINVFRCSPGYGNHQIFPGISKLANCRKSKIVPFWSLSSSLPRCDLYLIL